MMASHENKECFDKISVSVMIVYRISFNDVCGFRFWAIFYGGFAVLDDFFFGFAVPNTPQYPPR